MHHFRHVKKRTKSSTSSRLPTSAFSGCGGRTVAERDITGRHDHGYATLTCRCAHHALKHARKLVMVLPMMNVPCSK
jgi:hypothetical protein